MRYGNMPNDGGNLIFTDDEKIEFLKTEPKAEPYFRQFIGSKEFINGNPRWCLWLKDVNRQLTLKTLPMVLDQIEKVKEFRLNSTAKPTRDAASTPALFFFISHPNTTYIGVPEVSTERREYIPIGFIAPEIIASNKIYIIPSADLFFLVCSLVKCIWHGREL